MDADAFTEYGHALGEVEEQVVFHHGSLKKGPWKEPRACVGRLPLKTPDPEKQANARNFFDIAETQAGHPIQVPNDGTADTVKTLLIVGAHIARHTLFEYRK